MAKKGRTTMSGRNFMFSVVSRTVGMITGLAGRTVFVRTLSSDYLGLGGFFGNIFSVISLCELGIGAAIAQSLYKPLAKGDDNQTAAVMNFYIKVNRIIAVITFLLSICAVPILPILAKGSVDRGQMLCAYMLFALHTSLSYILSPKKTLVVADQRMYVVSAVNTVTGIVSLILQSLVLVNTGNYIAYLLTRIVILTVRDALINYYADKKYTFLHKKITPDREYKGMIKKNVKALLWHKLGGTLCRSTDSLLISAFVGLSGMGKYSNYALVIGTVGAFFDVAINAVTASVGNLGASDRGRKSEGIMRKMYFLNFFVLTVGLSVLVSVINPFVRLWLGEEMLFSMPETAIIVASFYFSCIRDPVQIFLNTYGIFRETRFIPMVRAAVNFLLSAALVKQYGIMGVFIGTVVSTVTVPLYFEVKMLYKYGFGRADSKPFIKEMTGYIVNSGVIAALCCLITGKLPETPLGVCMKGTLAFALSCFLLCYMYGNSSYFDYFKSMTTRAFVTIKRRRDVGGKTKSA